MKAFNRRAHPAGARFADWSAPDGAPLRRMDWPQPGRRRPRGSLLFAGGRGDFIEKYLEAYAHWHDAGWAITAFDWRGQGASRAAGEEPDSLDPLVGDLSALLEGWRAETPGPHAAVGHSMGGHLLLRVLAERRPALDAAVLVAPMLAINAAPLPGWGAAWTASLMSMFAPRGQPAWHQPSSAPPAGSLRQAILTGSAERYEDEIWWWEKQPSYQIGPPSWGWLDAAYRSTARLTPAALAAVATPILLIGAEKDRLVSPAAIRHAAAALPEAELLMFKESGHEILREEDAVRIAAHEAILAFLDRHAPR
jgi:lysophospholipase